MMNPQAQKPFYQFLWLYLSIIIYNRKIKSTQLHSSRRRRSIFHRSIIMEFYNLVNSFLTFNVNFFYIFIKAFWALLDINLIFISNKKLVQPAIKYFWWTKLFWTLFFYVKTHVFVKNFHFNFIFEFWKSHKNKKK